MSKTKSLAPLFVWNLWAVHDLRLQDLEMQRSVMGIMGDLIIERKGILPSAAKCPSPTMWSS